MDLDIINLDNYILYLEERYKKKKKEFINISINAFLYEEKELLNNNLEYITDFLNELKSPMSLESVYQVLEFLMGRLSVDEREEDVIYINERIELDFEDSKLIESNNDNTIIRNEFREKSILNLQEPYIKKLTEMKYKVIDLLNYLENIDVDKFNGNNYSVTESHQHIFCNNGFALFEYILNNHISENRGRCNDVSFFYWKMYLNKPQYIHQKPEVFNNWFTEKYNGNFAKIRPFNEVDTIKRNKLYAKSLDWFKALK